MNWLGPSLLSLTAALLGGVLTWIGAARNAKASRDNAARVRREERDADRQKEAATAARERNRETRHAIEKFTEMLGNAVVVDRGAIEERIVHIDRTSRLRSKVRSRLREDQVLLDRFDHLIGLQMRQRLAMIDFLHAADNAAVTELLTQLVPQMREAGHALDKEMEDRGWPW